MRTFFLSVSIAAALLSGCDIRKSDRLAVNAPLQQQVVIKDPTTVKVIDSAFDFGTVQEGEVVQYNYRFVNSGDKPLIVTNVAASCGCTIPEKPDAPVQPKDTGYIKVKFNSENHPGKAHKTISVQSNAPGFPDLLLTGTVQPKPAQ